MEQTSQTLFERLGGAAGVAALIQDFYDRVLADVELRPFFDGVSLDKLRRMQFQFFAVALDGPVEYSGQPIHLAHYGRGITRHHLSRFLDHLLESVARMDLDEHDRREIISRINLYADQVTGTPVVAE